MLMTYILLSAKADYNPVLLAIQKYKCVEKKAKDTKMLVSLLYTW